MRLLCVMVVLVAAGSASAALPELDGKVLVELDAEVPALVADRADCAKVATHVTKLADLFGKVTKGQVNPARPVSAEEKRTTYISEVKLLAHSIAVVGALTPTCLATLDKKLVMRLAHGVAIAPLIVSVRRAQPASKGYDKVPQPQTIPPEAQQQLGLFEFYVKHADATDPERPSVLFMRANVYRAWGHLADAIPIYLEIIDKHSKHEVAEYAANLALDAYNRLQKYDDLIALAKKLQGIPGFLEKRQDLKDTIAQIMAMSNRRGAETCEKTARDSKDKTAMAKCADGYLAIYNANPKAFGADEALYNAAVVLEMAGSYGAAISTFTTLRRSFPRSKLAARAGARLAKLYGHIGMYAESAALLEEYAINYAGEKDAFQALSEAAFYYRSFGNTAKVAELTKRGIRIFGVKYPAEVGQMQFALLVLAEQQRDEAAIAAHATAYLQLRAARGDHARRIAATVKLAQSAWRRSCPVPGIDGLCIERVVPTAAPRVPAVRSASPSCGPAGNKLKVVARKPALVAEALKGFKAAVADFEKLGGRDLDETMYAHAGLPSGDVELEASLALPAPTDPKGYSKWIAEKQTRATAAIDRYTHFVKLKGAGGVAAISRTALAQQLFVDSVFSTPIPPAIRTHPDVVDAFCDQMTKVVEPLETQAKTSYRTCLATATSFNIIDASSRTCERGLQQLDPSSAAPLVEPLRAPDVVSVPPQLESVLETLQIPATTEFRKLDQSKWTPKDCDRIAKQFLAAAPQQGAGAFFMAGLAHHRCNNIVEAQRAYRQAGTHGWALSNLGAIAKAAGKDADAKKLWDDALRANGKLVAARVNLALGMLDELRKQTPATAPWQKLAEDIRFQLSSALAVDNEHVGAYVTFGLLYLEGADRQKSRLALAKLLFEEANKRAPADPVVANAIGAMKWRDGASSVAFDHFTTASASSTSVEARLNLALASIQLRKFADAKKLLVAIKVAPALAYDHAIALGVANRGLVDHGAAETAYNGAIKLDARRPEAYFSLGALQEQLAARASDLTVALAAYKQAAEHYRKAGSLATGTLKADAVAQAAVMDKIIAQIAAFQAAGGAAPATKKQP